MKYSLRKTPSHLHLAYKYGEASDGLLGRNFVLDVDDRQLTLNIDLTPNFHTRNKAASAYLDAVSLAHNHHKLRFLQCSDNLVRARLIKAWETVQHPQMRMCLELGQRGHYLYAVQPHSLFMGGIQLDVLQVLEEADAPVRNHFHEFHSARTHA
jgi:alpha-tubulin suppressor-like RCC1 family protein